MNNIFNTTEKIDLDNNHYLEPDGFNGVCLVHHFLAEKNKKNGGKEDYTKESRKYYPRVAMALEQYLNSTQNSIKNLDEVLDKTKEALEVIRRFDKQFNQWGK